MVRVNKYVAAAAAIAAINKVNAVTTLPITAEDVQMAELVVYVDDILGHMMEYLSFRQVNPNQPYPSVLNDVVFQAMMNTADDSWTTALTGIDPSTVQMMLTGVP